MIKAEKTAIILGLLGLIPFIVPVLLIWFVDNETARILETLQTFYAILIIAFMGGVQWGYTVKLGDQAKPYQFLVSVVSTLVLFATIALALMVEPHHIAILFVILILGQTIYDHYHYTEKWFLKLRWFLSLIASFSIGVVAIHQYLSALV